MDNLSAMLNQHTFQTDVVFRGELSGIKHFGQTGQLHLLESGNVRVQYQSGKEILLDRPSVILFPDAISHSLTSEGEHPAKLISSTMKFAISKSSPILKALPKMVYFQLNEHCTFSNTVRWLLNEVFEHRFAHKEMIDKLGEILVLQVLRHATEKGILTAGTINAINHPQLSKVIHQIHCHPAQNWTLDNLAQLAAMSRSKFAESFKNCVGQTPNEYITDLRLALAQKLLKRNKPVNLVAGEVGYEHGSALARIFKKKMGISPKQWQQQLKQPHRQPSLAG